MEYIRSLFYADQYQLDHNIVTDAQTGDRYKINEYNRMHKIGKYNQKALQNIKHNIQNDNACWYAEAEIIDDIWVY